MSGWRSLLAAGVDLLLPADCPACGAPTVALDGRLPFCAGCAPEWQVCPFPARPSPAPDGLPACLAAGSYEGIWRATILSYKDGRRSLSGVLGDALAEVVGHGVGAAPKAWPLVLVPVPSTAAAIRARQGDHMVRLARRAAAALRRFGWSAAVRRPVREAELAEDEDDQPWHIARMKEHPSEPMAVDDALFQMELVGHDFYLFMDKESGRPSVVYRRKGYDYGVIALAA